MPTDEKLIGTVHVAVGMNNLCGGTNDSPLHIDFVVRPDAVTIDGAAIMADGAFSKEIRATLE